MLSFFKYFWGKHYFYKHLDVNHSIVEAAHQVFGQAVVFCTRHLKKGFYRYLVYKCHLDSKKRNEIYFDVFGPSGILRNSKTEAQFDDNALQFLLKHGRHFERHYGYVQQFMQRLLNNVLNPSWISKGKQ